MNSAHRKSQGFTLLEVLLVVAVLMVVLGAVFLLVTQNQRTYQIQQSPNRGRPECPARCRTHRA